MLIPWNTDAPIYHWPFGTVGLIVVNYLVFVAMVSAGWEEGSWVYEYMLIYGDGLHPVQWVTRNFMHADFIHLLGNMLFLWGFGIVVEGKIGWPRYLAAYLGLAVIQSAAEQMILSDYQGASLGASGAIYGILAMAMVWAPENEVECVLLLGFRTQMIEVRIYTFAMLYIAFEFIMAAIYGFEFGSAIIHLFGAVLGFALGAVMLKQRWVDCEGWDLFAKWGGRLGERPHEEKAPAIDPAEVERLAELEREKRREKQFELVRQLIADGKPIAAQSMYLGQKGPQPVELSELDLIKLITALHGQQAWNESVPLMVEYLKRFSEKAARMRLKLAEILIQKQARPRQALRVLKKLDGQLLPEPLAAARKKLEQQAEVVAEDAELELQCEDW